MSVALSKQAEKLFDGSRPKTYIWRMASALIDLLFWTGLFVVLFFLFRWLQARKKRDTPPQDD